MTDKTEIWRYDAITDGRVLVTQEWVDATQRRLNQFSEWRQRVRKLASECFVDPESGA